MQSPRLFFDWMCGSGRPLVWPVVAGALLILLGSCQPQDYRERANEAADRQIAEGQERAFGEERPFTIDTPANRLRRRLLEAQVLPVSSEASLGPDELEAPEHWPEEDVPERTEAGEVVVPEWQGGGEEPLELSLHQALMVAAHNNRSYQSTKEEVFRAALDVDLELDQFRNTYTGSLETIFSTDQDSPTQTGFEHAGTLGIERQLEAGATLSGQLAMDLVQLLSNGGASARGLAFDGSIEVPLLRGAGRHIVTEPLTQARRDLIYQLWRLARFRRELVVNVVSEYLGVLQAQDRVENAAQNYRNLVRAQRETMAMREAERVNQIELDQNRQSVLEARNRWISEQDNHARALDSFKQTLGLPTDAAIELSRGELDRLAEQAEQRLGGDLPTVGSQAEAIPRVEAPVELEGPDPTEAGPLELEVQRAIRMALNNRLDMRLQEGQVYDAQRGVIVAADALEAGLDLTGHARFGGRRSLGSARVSDANLRPGDGFYSAGLMLDLPLERTAERHSYRNSYIKLAQEVRDVQSLEDQIKFNIRDQLRILRQQRTSYKIQAVALQVAQRQVEQTRAFREEGVEGVEVRDLLEAEADLLDARNSLTAALVEYRVAELELQRDMGVLAVDERGLYDEFEPIEP